MGPDLNDLRYFLEVKARGSLTSAARALGVSQPSLTAAMQRLERHFGTKLLQRDHSGTELTVTGRALANDTVELFEVLARAERRVSGLEDAESGRFTIGCHESLGAYFLPAFFQEFFAAHPGIDVAVHNASSGNVRDAVLERHVDFGLVVNPRPHPDLVQVHLFDDAVDFFVAPKKQGARKASPAKDLEAALAIVSRGPVVHASRVLESQELIGKLEAMGAKIDRSIACGDFELVKSIALSGVGVGILPRRVASYGHDGGLVRLHPELPHFSDKIFLVFRADLHRTKAAVIVKDELVQRGKALRATKP